MYGWWQSESDRGNALHSPAFLYRIPIPHEKSQIFILELKRLTAVPKWSWKSSRCTVNFLEVENKMELKLH